MDSSNMTNYSTYTSSSPFFHIILSSQLYQFILNLIKLGKWKRSLSFSDIAIERHRKLFGGGMIMQGRSLFPTLRPHAQQEILSTVCSTKNELCCEIGYYSTYIIIRLTITESQKSCVPRIFLYARRNADFLSSGVSPHGASQRQAQKNGPRLLRNHARIIDALNFPWRVKKIDFWDEIKYI